MGCLIISRLVFGLLVNWRLLILQGGHYVGEKLVAVVLEDWTKFLVNLLLYQLWRDHQHG